MSNDKKIYKPIGKRVLIRASVNIVGAGGVLLPYKREDFKEMLNRKKQILFNSENMNARTN